MKAKKEGLFSSSEGRVDGGSEVGRAAGGKVTNVGEEIVMEELRGESETETLEKLNELGWKTKRKIENGERGRERGRGERMAEWQGRARERARRQDA